MCAGRLQAVQLMIRLRESAQVPSHRDARGGDRVCRQGAFENLFPPLLDQAGVSRDMGRMCDTLNHPERVLSRRRPEPRQKQAEPCRRMVPNQTVKAGHASGCHHTYACMHQRACRTSKNVTSCRAQLPVQQTTRHRSGCPSWPSRHPAPPLPRTVSCDGGEQQSPPNSATVEASTTTSGSSPPVTSPGLLHSVTTSVPFVRVGDCSHTCGEQGSELDDVCAFSVSC